MPSKVFSADTFSPYPVNPEIFDVRYQKILQVSREKYATDRQSVEQKIYKSIKDLEIQEEKAEAYKEKLKEEKKKAKLAEKF
jgi:DNA gyrase/topoisomerase IV subunit A